MSLDILLRERSVTRAASQLGVTQSAMSHALRRLRSLLDDPVLVRGAGGMLPTPRAEALELPVRRALDGMQRALSAPVDFDPARARRTFRVATPDLFDMAVLPRLAQALAAAAPHVDLAIRALPLTGLAAQLEAGDLDVAVVPQLLEEALDGQGEALQQRVLLRDHFVCILREGHPALARKAAKKAPRPALSLAQYAALSHVVVSPAGHGSTPIDAALAKHTLTRRVPVRVPSIGTALAIARETDLVLTAPALLGPQSFGGGTIACPLPIQLPRHAVRMVWHARFNEDPGHRWLRSMLAGVCRRLATSLA